MSERLTNEEWRQAQSAFRGNDIQLIEHWLYWVGKGLEHLQQLADERGKALEWYANESNHNESLEPYQCPFTKQELIRYQTIDAPIVSDKGERARQALGKEQTS
jgi:hypothetical protein